MNTNIFFLLKRHLFKFIITSIFLTKALTKKTPKFQHQLYKVLNKYKATAYFFTLFSPVSFFFCLFFIKYPIHTVTVLFVISLLVLFSPNHWVFLRSPHMSIQSLCKIRLSSSSGSILSHTHACRKNSVWPRKEHSHPIWVPPSLQCMQQRLMLFK